MSRGHGIIPYGDPSYSIQQKAMVGDCLEAQELFDDIMGYTHWKEVLDFLSHHPEEYLNAPVVECVIKVRIHEQIEEYKYPKSK